MCTLWLLFDCYTLLKSNRGLKFTVGGKIFSASLRLHVNEFQRVKILRKKPTYFLLFMSTQNTLKIYFKINKEFKKKCDANARLLVSRRRSIYSCFKRLTQHKPYTRSCGNASLIYILITGGFYSYWLFWFSGCGWLEQLQLEDAEPNQVWTHTTIVS